MCAYAYDYVNTPANNSNYASGTISRTVASAPVASSATTVASSGVTLGKVLSVGGKVLSRANLITGALSLLYEGYQYMTAEDIAKLPESEQEVVKQAEALKKTVDTQKEGTQSLKEEVKAVADGVNDQQGQTLPSVLSQNAKALTLSVNALTSTLSEQLGLMNNYMMANLIYQQQFLDLKTEVGDLKIEAMQYDKNGLNKVYDSDGNLMSDMVAPREWVIRKNATVAKDMTDKINYDVDDLLDDSPIDLSSIIGYEDGSDIMREYILSLGGTVS